MRWGDARERLARWSRAHRWQLSIGVALFVAAAVARRQRQLLRTRQALATANALRLQ